MTVDFFFLFLLRRYSWRILWDPLIHRDISCPFYIELSVVDVAQLVCVWSFLRKKMETMLKPLSYSCEVSTCEYLFHDLIIYASPCLWFYCLLFYYVQ